MYFVVDLDNGKILAGGFKTKAQAVKVMQKEYPIEEMGLDSNIGVVSSKDLGLKCFYRVKAFDKGYGDYLFLTDNEVGNMSAKEEDAYVFGSKAEALETIKNIQGNDFGYEFEIEKVK